MENYIYRYIYLLLYIALSYAGTPGREQNFDGKANNLANFSNRATKTAQMVAAGSSGGNKKLAEALLSSSGQVCTGFTLITVR